MRSFPAMTGRKAKLMLILLLLAAGLVLQLAGLLDVDRVLELVRDLPRGWGLAVVLVLVQAVLFTFALAGSLFLWVAATLYPPPQAAMILAAGGTLGGLGAYFFSRYLTADWKRRIETSRGYRLLHSRGDFFSLFAMRIFPGFPHALVNYSAGILRARIDHFMIAAILGIFVKSYIYARAIYPASSELSLRVLLDFTILAPLLVLAVLSLSALFFTRGNGDT